MRRTLMQRRQILMVLVALLGATTWVAAAAPASYAQFEFPELDWDGDGFIGFADMCPFEYGGPPFGCPAPADTTPPTSSDDVPAGWQDGAVYVALSASDGVGSGVAAIYYTTDGSTPTTSSLTFGYNGLKPVLQNGERIRYFAVDQAGNAEAVRTSGAAKVDSAAPSTTDDVDSAWHDAPVAVTLTASDTDGSGVAATYFTTDGSTPTTSSPVYHGEDQPTLSDGLAIRYFSVDQVGNAEAVRTSGAAKVDTVAPDTELESALIDDTGNATFRFGGSDVAPSSGGLAYRCRLDGNAYTPCTSPVTYPVVAAGSHSFDVVATDAVGNQDATPAHYAFTVAGTAVTALVTDPVGGTVSTDPSGTGPTTDAPVQAAVTTPGPGTVTITKTAATGDAPAGFAFLGQQFLVEAPVATQNAPLQLVFRLAAEALPAGTTAENLTIYRDGEAAAACTGSGTATPDPCVSERLTLPDGTIVITVLAVHASTWNIAAPSAPAATGTPDPASPTAATGPTPVAAASRPPASTPRASTPLVISRLGVNRRCVRAGRGGVAFRFALSHDAVVRYDILRRVRSPVWPICPPTGGTVPITFAGVWHEIGPQSAGPHQTTLATAARHPARRAAAHGGRHRISLARAAAGRRLRPGTYLLRITAVDAQGQSAAPVSVKFWVLRARRAAAGRGPRAAGV